MVDGNRPILLGFDTAVADVGDQLHLCHPLLSFEGDPTLYVARRLNWRNDQDALAVVDPSEASELGTLLPDTHRQPITSGQGVVAAGTEFVQAADTAEIQLDGFGMDFARLHDAECWISVTTPAHFERLKTGVADRARAVFDEALGDAARHRRPLSERGDAALLLLRRCGPRRRDDLAIRQLAGARQNDDLDLYRRLLIRFAFELSTQEDDLHEKVERHMALAERPRHTASSLSLKKYLWIYKAPTSKVPSVTVLEKLPSQHIPLSGDNVAEQLHGADDELPGLPSKMIRSWNQKSSDFREVMQLKEPLINSGLRRALPMEKRVLRLRFATLRTNEAIVPSFLKIKDSTIIKPAQPSSTHPRTIRYLDNTKVSRKHTEKTVKLPKTLSVSRKV